MDDPKSQTLEIEGDEPRSVGQAVERLFEGAVKALTRAANCDDADWQKFHLGTAAAYSEWARQMEPLVGIQARIDKQVAMIRRRFNLPPLPSTAAIQTPHDSEQEDMVTPDTSSQSGSGHDL